MPVNLGKSLSRKSGEKRSEKVREVGGNQTMPGLVDPCMILASTLSNIGSHWRTGSERSDII